MLGLKHPTIPVLAYVDNRGLVEIVYSTKMADDRRLHIDLASIKELIHSEEMITVKWCPRSQQLADSLTKRGASGHKFLEVLQKGAISLK